jgi:hypothetical protein
VPFTAAHPLAVLPAVHVRRVLRLDATCLVLGSMAPDFEYFIRGGAFGRFGHTWLGLCAWGVPVTLVLAAAFHGFVKWPMLLAAPTALTGPFGRPWPWRRTLGGVVSLVASAALGDASHMLWDGATHHDGLFVEHIAALSTPCSVPWLGHIALYRILQHTSSIVGLAGVAGYVAWLVRRQPAPRVVGSRSLARWVFTGCIAIGAALAIWHLHARGVIRIGHWVIELISGGLAGIVVASAILYPAARRYQARVEAALAAAAGATPASRRR